ncbi:hypothetical protein [Synechocystis salina]|nr:hypothetical protein [Synechocystis salina]
MSLADITDFGEALALLGLYEREVMTTGVMEYVVPPKPPAKSVKEPKPSTSSPQEKTAPATLPNPAEEAPALPAATPAPSPVNNTTINEGIVIVNGAQDVEDSNEPPSPIPTVEEHEKTLPSKPPGPSELELLLEQQELENRLFYFFIDEVEKTGDLGKLPVALQPASKN